MGIAIAIASGKGGTGKTTVCASLSVALSRRGKRVLAIDCDFGLRNLDLALGLFDSTAFDLADAIHELCSPADTIIHHPKYENLDFICAPQDERKADFPESSFATLVRELEPLYDYILLDCPASIGHAFYCATAAAKQGIIVTLPQEYALRDATKIAGILVERGIETKLIVNMLRIKHIGRGYSKNVDNIMDIVALPLLGVVPYDENIPAYQNRELNIMDDDKLMAAKAFSNISMRILGEHIPILKLKKGLFR